MNEKGSIHTWVIQNEKSLTADITWIGTIHKQSGNFSGFLTPLSPLSKVFSTICRKFWPMFDPSQLPMTSFMDDPIGQKAAILTQILKFESRMGSNVRARPLTVFITWKKKHPLLAFLDKRVGQENTRWVGLCCCCSHFNLSNKFCCWSFCIQVAFQWIGNGLPLAHIIWEIQTWFTHSKRNM